MKIDMRFISTALLLGTMMWVSPLRAADIQDGHLHNLSKAEVMNRVILAVMEDYYDSTRVNPRTMFKGGIDELVKNVAELRATWSPDGATVRLDILKAAMAVSMSDVRSPWGASRAFQQVFRFIHENLPTAGEPDYRMIEYAAVNGLLATLDPHTSAMMPDIWGEMQMSTQGEFEGVGIRITTDRRPPCGGELTVVEVFKDTPAFKAGLKTGDKIIRIDGDSTVNITTDEAASRLRGKRGTTVNVRLKRPDGSVKDVPIVRQTIPIESVKWQMLADQVGYMELTGFQQSSAEEMRDALLELNALKMKGLILDLRGNPGGLLNAAIEIVDLFISNGTIVTTAGRRSDDRDVTNATSDNTEPDYPMVILIDAYSASAAEIVAGAVRNHGRALLIGERSFGKGSVQTIMPLPGDGALRMTIQQYLTPGDISIQAVGVRPDIRFAPSAVNKDELIISSRERQYSEASLDAHLIGATSISRADRPGERELEYYVPEKERRLDMDEFQKCYLPTPERKPFRSRFEVEFARSLIARTSGTTTAELMVDATAMIESISREQETGIRDAFKRMKIDWTPKTPGAVATAMTPSADLTASVKVVGQPVAGKKFVVSVSVTNRGKQTIHRLRGKTVSDNPYLTEIDLAFGAVPPGSTRKWDAPVELFPLQGSRVDPVHIDFFSDEGVVPARLTFDLAVERRVNPELVYDWFLEDLGNGNGFMEPGESFQMHLNIRNDGKGSTMQTGANLSSIPGVDVEKGHFDIGILKPGKSASGTFKFKIHDKFTLDKAKVRLTFEEWVPFKIPTTVDLLYREILFPVSTVRASTGTASGTITVTSDKDVLVFEAPDVLSRRVAHVAPGASFTVDRKYKEFFRIVFGAGRFAWISDKRVVPGGKGDSTFVPLPSLLPRVDIDGGPSRAVRGATVKISGVARHDGGVRDLLIFVDGTKVLYQLNEPRSSSLAFSLDVPVALGANQIRVIARHDDKTYGYQNVFIRRTE